MHVFISASGPNRAEMHVFISMVSPGRDIGLFISCDY